MSGGPAMCPAARQYAVRRQLPRAPTAAASSQRPRTHIPAPGSTRPVKKPAPDHDEVRPVRARRRGPGPFTLLVLPGLAVLLGFAVFLTATGRLPGMAPGADDGQSSVAVDGVSDKGTDRVDPSYVPWLKEAAKKCSVLRPSVLAAQIDAHSGWNTDPAALSDATGIAGFTAAQWRRWGKDADGNGSSSAQEPVDAIMALGQRDCALAGEMAQLRTRGTVTGELLDLSLASFTAGREAVEAAGRVPAGARAYLRRIDELSARYVSFDKQDPAPAPGAAAQPGFLRWPAHTTSVSSPYGTREHPLSGVTKLHTGVDFPAGRDTPVTAAKAGTVVFAAPTKAYGNRVVIDHGSVDGKRLQTTYSHLSVLRTSNGRAVTAGAVLGDVGSTGLSTGPHLHFEVILDGYYTDPLPWLDAKR